MQLQAKVSEQGVFHCANCLETLMGYDAMFDVCNTCAMELLIEPTEGDDDKPVAGDDDPDTSDIPTGPLDDNE